MTDRSPTAIRVWTRLFRAQQVVLSAVEEALKNAGLPPLAWYDVLLELERAGKDGLRPFELQERLLLPQYGISRLLERMRGAGYLERHRCEEDRRGQRLTLTPAGSDMRQHMWPVYRQAVEAAVGSKLPAADAERLSGLLGRLA